MAFLASLTGWDYLVLFVVLMSLGLGAFRGMVRTVADLASWAVAFIAAPLLSPLVLSIPGMAPYPSLALVLSFVAAFFLTRLVGVAVAKGLTSVGLAGADRALGGLVGLVRAVLIVAGIATAGKMIELDKQPAWKAAVSRDLLEVAARTVQQYVPAMPDLRQLARGRAS
ncbi:MAG: CvpA family protein [Burkholderiaceae bacterium]